MMATDVVCSEISRRVEFDIGSLLSNTLVMCVVLVFLIYIIYAILKYRRLYPFDKDKKDRQDKN
jgi:hypothetical protein